MKKTLNGVTFLSLALEVLNVWFTSIWMEAILDFAKMAVLSG